MAKSLFRALVALSFLAPLWLNAAPRVITLSPANTELAFAAGITPVGVSSYSDYPPQAKKIEQGFHLAGMNLERIVALKPDLVIARRGGNASGRLTTRFAGNKSDVGRCDKHRTNCQCVTSTGPLEPATR